MNKLECESIIALADIRSTPLKCLLRLPIFAEIIMRVYEIGAAQGRADARLIDSNRAIK